jgi:predicted Rossmann-fold nucleotide-binding protein
VVVARSVRGDDWLGRSGPAQYALLLSGGLPGAMAAAARVVGAIGALGVPGLGVCAGVTLLASATAAGPGAACATGT